jgi:hypothetical protein
MEAWGVQLGLATPLGGISLVATLADHVVSQQHQVGPFKE